MKSVRGFTLIEMMVVLLIGVMIALMASQIYVLSMQTALNQERLANKIDHQAFAMPAVIANIRLAGLGIDEQVLAKPNPIGILIDQAQLTKQSPSNDIEQYLTKSGKSNRNNRTSTPSEQLSIIYRAPQDMWDCEGKMALGPRRVRLKGAKMAQIDGQIVIERYFVKQTDGVMGLRCNAAHFVPEKIVRDGTRDRKFHQSSTSYLSAIIDADAKDKKTANTIYGLHGEGQVIADNVEGLWVQFAVQMPDGIRLMTIDEYKKSAMDMPIVMINLALLSHDAMPLMGDKVGGHSFEVFGKTIALNNKAPNYDRQIYQISVNLRNVNVSVP